MQTIINMAPKLLILKAPIKKRCLRRLLYNCFFKAKKGFLLTRESKPVLSPAFLEKNRVAELI
jgi:hypothetical protein